MKDLTYLLLECTKIIQIIRTSLRKTQAVRLTFYIETSNI